MNVTDLSVAQLHQILAIKEQIENLQTQLESIADVGGEAATPSTKLPKERRMSAAGRAAIAAGARARWARIKGTGATSEPVKVKRKLSPAHRRKLIKALARARAMRWGKGKSESKPAKKDRRSSPATRAKLAAAARVRWARVKAEGKKAL